MVMGYGFAKSMAALLAGDSEPMRFVVIGGHVTFGEAMTWWGAAQ
jgi:hypothetical protein